VSYKDLLKENIIRTSSGIYDTKKTGKVYFQNIGHEDFVFWLQILKQNYSAKNTNTVTTLYREQKKSLSANKMRAAKWTWNIYRNVENLGVIKTGYYFLNYAVRAGLKYLK
jgi:hypothetical protein